MTQLSVAPLTHFDSPGDTTAPAPPEERGVARDGVRMLVATDEGVAHAHFRDLAAYLSPGDLVVVNNSATLAAEFDAVGRELGAVVVHAATRLDDGTWVVELRSAPDAARAVLDAAAGAELDLPGGSRLTLLAPYPRPHSSPTGRGNRLWRAAVSGPRPLEQHLVRYGRPIAYGYLDRPYPLSAYQTVFANRPGSAEMPSAARPFTHELVSDLVAQGIGVAAITLHTGVSSQEAGEAPQPEWFEVSAMAARLVNATLAEGGRVVAVGTTVTRALESAVESAVDSAAESAVESAVGSAVVVPRSGWTTRVVSRDDPPRVVSGLVTGWHDPQASHLLLVEAVAGTELTQRAYDGAARGGYLWHEFGDSALLLPGHDGPGGPAPGARPDRSA